MEKKEFTQQAKFLGVSVIIFAIVCAVAFWPQKQTLDEKKKIQSTQNTIVEEATMASELKIEDTLVGTGAEVQSGDTIRIHYHGTLEDGTIFDSSVDRGEPFEAQIGVGMLIQGWDQGIPGMKVGGKRRLTIPPELGYGNRAIGNIPANSTLIFDVELLDIL
ncbi:MAG: FKBP-type peptidyl-prolyl cis-trans isomerase [bacterium]|nr:FKBP-type peptidyl-prolyl cis-trans isomerase [bacterium]